MIEFKDGKSGCIKVMEDYGETIGKIKLYPWSGEYLFFPKKIGFSSDDFLLIGKKLMELNSEL